MTAYRIPPDIGNRALQHCGASRMDPLLGFADTSSKGAAEISFCYDKLREAELQRRVWTFATRRQVLRAIDTTTMRLVPSLWEQGATYFVGSIVSDQNNYLWISRVRNNLGNDPLLTTAWDPYFGPLTVSAFAGITGTTSYSAGELVYTYAGNGTSLVYLSLINGNGDVPGVATTYSPTVTYFKNQVVTFGSTAYMSLIDLNLNNEPDLAPALFNIATTYAVGNQVGGSDGVIYQSIGSGNIGNDPTLDGGVHWTNTGILNPWTTVFVGGSGSLNWLLIGGSGFPAGVGLTTLNIVYPVGAGPCSDPTTNNVYRLPSGYLRLAPQNPKPGIPALGGPSGIGYSDWLVESDYLITADSSVTLRFVADITDVSRMHTMFCEGLAARIGLEVCESVTQSTAKLTTIAKIYDRWISDAGEVDAVEDGFTDAPDDDYVTVRF
jgi:hypothetical protein